MFIQYIAYTFFLSFGIALMLMGLYELKRARASQAWPTTLGQIVSSRLVEEDDPPDMDGGGGTYFSSDIRYQYVVNGIEYSGDHVCYGDYAICNVPFEAVDMVRRYPVGRAAEVHYDPSDPSKAVLECRPYWQNLGTIVFGMGLA